MLSEVLLYYTTGMKAILNNEHFVKRYYLCQKIHGHSQTFRSDSCSKSKEKPKLPNGCQQFKLVSQTVSGNGLQYFQSRHKNGFNSQCKKPEL